MAIDRALMGEPLEEGEQIEVEIVNPEQVGIDTPDGGMLIDFDPDMGEMMGLGHDDNLAEAIDNRDLDALASELVGSFRSDKESRADWERSYVKGLDLLGLKQNNSIFACAVYGEVFVGVIKNNTLAFLPSVLFFVNNQSTAVPLCGDIYS